jgi:hypothetical protein
MRRSSMRLLGRYLPVTDRLRWTPATRPTTNTPSTNPTSGATWPHGVGPPARRERASSAGRSVVVRDGRDRPAPSGCAVARRGDSTASTSARRALHHDYSGTGQRGRAGPRFRSGPPPVGGQPGLGRKRLGRRLGQPAWPSCRRSDACHLRGTRGRGRLLPVMPTAEGTSAASSRMLAPFRRCESPRPLERRSDHVGQRPHSLDLA